MVAPSARGRRKKFRVVLADPPWPFRDGLPGPGRGAASHYRTLSIADLCAYPLPPLEVDCTLFLWRVAAMQQEALEVMAAWGFVPKTEVVWVKRTATGQRWFGMGRTVRAEHEVCLIGTRGRPVTRDRSVRSTFEAAAGVHSRKPDCFYGVIEALRQGPYVELFARRPWPGWTSLGAQLPDEEA